MSCICDACEGRTDKCNRICELEIIVNDLKARLQGTELAMACIVAYLRRPNGDNSECSAEREMLAQRIERGEHLK